MCYISKCSFEGENVLKLLESKVKGGVEEDGEFRHVHLICPLFPSPVEEIVPTWKSQLHLVHLNISQDDIFRSISSHMCKSQLVPAWLFIKKKKWVPPRHASLQAVKVNELSITDTMQQGHLLYIIEMRRCVYAKKICHTGRLIISSNWLRVHFFSCVQSFHRQFSYVQSKLENWAAVSILWSLFKTDCCHCMTHVASRTCIICIRDESTQDLLLSSCHLMCK